MKWAAISKDNKTLIIESDGVTWKEAHAYAVRHFGPLAEVIVHETGEDAIADIQIRWIGSDYSAGSSPECKRMQQREYHSIAGSWGAWEEVR
jgi:hypothetical protein